MKELHSRQQQFVLLVAYLFFVSVSDDVGGSVITSSCIIMSMIYDAEISMQTSIVYRGSFTFQFSLTSS